MHSKLKNIPEGSLLYDIKNNSLVEVIDSSEYNNRSLVLLGFDNYEPILTHKKNFNLLSKNFILLDANIHKVATNRKYKKAIHKNKFPSWTVKKIKVTGMDKFACYKTALFDVGDGHYIYAYSLKQKTKNREK